MEWSYGITTVPARFNTTLPKTIASLKAAGFDNPRLYVDGHDDSKLVKDRFGLEATCHFPNLRTFGNWITTLWDIYIRNPHALRYAIFQDDFITCSNLKEYLEITPYPEKGYLNLYTFPANQERCPKGHVGFYPANQKGLGAVALIFTREAVEILLSHQHMAKRPQHKTRGHKAIDGGIVETFRKSGWKEYVHNPSLVQHIGRTSSMGNRTQPLATSFLGEGFDLLRLLDKQTELPEPIKPKDKRDRWDKFLFREAIELCNKDLPIIEIGCIRDIRPIAARADGHSTVHWGKSGIKTTTIDIDSNAIKIASKLTSKYTNVELRLGDGFEYLKNLKSQIGVLYLDGPHPKKEDGTTFSDKCYTEALPNMGIGSVLLIDDCDVSPGKGDLVIPRALNDGFELIKKDRQCLMVRRTLTEALLSPKTENSREFSVFPRCEPYRADQRLGLVGYNCSSGLGELNEQIATHLDIDLWLVKPHGKHKTKPNHEDCDTIICRNTASQKVEEFLNAVDTIVFCETPYFTTLPQRAKELGKRVVCIPMLEWTPRATRGWMQYVDSWVCPTKVCYSTLKKQGLPVELFECPIDTEKFQYQQRTIVKNFLYLNGHGGVGNRKGGDIIKSIMEITDLPIKVSSQQKGWSNSIASCKNPEDLYSPENGEVLLMPHRWDGVGLGALEASSCGMPIISTDGTPWNEFHSLAKIKSNTTIRKVGRKIHCFEPNKNSLIDIMEEWLGKDISTQSSEARLWAESRSWNSKKDCLQNMILGVESK